MGAGWRGVFDAAQRPTGDRRTGAGTTPVGIPSAHQRAEFSADFEQPCVELITSALRRAATCLGPFDLLLADDGEDRAKPFVIDNIALRNLQRVKGAVGQLDPLVADRQPPVGMINHSNPLADRSLRLVARPAA